VTSHTRKIAEFAADLKLSDVPKDVIARAKAIILDGPGNSNPTVAGLRSGDAAKPLRRSMRRW